MPSTTSRFAHLAGIFLGTRAETVDPVDPVPAPAAAAPAPASAAKKVEKEDDDKMEKDKDENEEFDEKKGKKAKSKAEKEDDEKCEDDPDEEMRGKSEKAAARKRERERCAAIFMTAAAARNPALAASLAFDTSMTRVEAVAVLESGASAILPPPAAARPTHADFLARGNGDNPAPVLGAAPVAVPDLSKPADFSSFVLAAVKKTGIK